MLERPTITALPERSPNRSFNIMRQPSGVHGTIASPPVAKRPVDHMEPVGILGRIDRIDHRLLVDLIREGQLHQNAVNRVVAVAARSATEALLARSCRAAHARSFASRPRASPCSYCGHRFCRRIGADQNDRQTWRQIMLVFQPRYCFSDPRAQIRRKRFAVDNVFIRHGVQPAFYAPIRRPVLVQ